MTHLSLFSGIGGIDLAAEWAGFESVGQCEFADYPTKVLEKHWPNVPRWRDIRTLTKESFYDHTYLRTVELLTGGFPCQPFSVAGKQKGKGDDRYLWPEMLRVIREITPCWVVGENVPGILKIAGDTVCQDLEREGYDVGIFNFEAAAVGASHRRERVFFVGYRTVENTRDSRCKQKRVLPQQPRGAESICAGESGANRAGSKMSTDVADPNTKWKLQSQRSIENVRGWPCDSGQNVADAQSIVQQESVLAYREGITRLTDSSYVSDTAAWGLQKPKHQSWQPEQICTIATERTQSSYGSWWPAEPDVGRVAHGVPSRVDRLKCLGNAVVPQQIYPILAAIAEIQRSTNLCSITTDN